MRVPIFLHVSFDWISATKFWALRIRLCICNGRMHHANVPDSKPYWLSNSALDIVRPVTVKSEYGIQITDETL